MAASPPNTDLLSNASLLKHLPEGSDIALHLVYQEIRPGVLRALERAGASKPEAIVYFQAALIEAAALARNGKYPVELPLFAGLEQLALAHFHSKQGMPSTNIDSWVPDAPALEESRNHLFTWRALVNLGTSCEQTLLSSTAEGTTIWGNSDRWSATYQDPTSQSAAEAPTSSSSEPISQKDTCTTALLTALKRPDEPLPTWAKAALERGEDYRIWKKIRALDQRLEFGMPISNPLPPNPTNRKLTKWILYLLAAGLLLSAAYLWYQNYQLQALFDEHFQPPQQLLTDINRRFENDTTGLLRPEACQTLLKEADARYSEEQYEEAEKPLRQLLKEDGLEDCYSDGCFALAIVLLKQDKPEEALEYLAKIDNIEAYGEDLYWYQALAMVQLARQQPSLKSVAKGAVERFLENTRNEERRQQATKLLQEL